MYLFGIEEAIQIERDFVNLAPFEREGEWPCKPLL
jgi:hypothetical protein